MTAQRPPWPSYFIRLILVASFVIIGLDRSGQLPWLRPYVSQLYQWIILLSGIGLLLGTLNVVRIHLRRIQQGTSEWGMSVVLLSALLVVLVAGLLDAEGVYGPVISAIFNSIIAPVQATLFALLAFFLASAAFLYLRVNRRGGLWMLAGVLIMLLIQMPMNQSILPVSVQFASNWLLSQPVMAAMRGLLLGSALALIVIFTRFLLGRLA